jgi:hypothetical protein
VKRDERVSELEARVELLEAALSAMREEVRTRRVVVEAPDGYERVVINALDEWGEITVQAKSSTDDGYGTLAKLYAGEGDGFSASFVLYGAGKPYLSADVTELEPDDARASAWGAEEIGDRCAADILVYRPDAQPGIVLDHEGVKNQRMRLYDEQARAKGLMTVREAARRERREELSR